MPYKPHPKSQAILNYAMAKIRSVPYRVNTRWVFYQLVQAGFINKKGVTKFEMLLSRARKNFWNGWHPDTLADTVRQCNFKGEGWYTFNLELDSIEDQDFYVQLWFEAQAMHEQFEHYTRDYRVSLIPFRGDCSIPIKWQIAKKIEAMVTKYEKPVKVLYFGDYDLKGIQIYIAAVKDIKAWCNVPFDVERVGLTLEQAERFNLPENPERLSMYQWEALSDEQAQQLILGSLEKYLHKITPSQQKREKDLQEEIESKIRDVLNNREVGD